MLCDADAEGGEIHRLIEFEGLSPCLRVPPRHRQLGVVEEWLAEGAEGQGRSTGQADGAWLLPSPKAAMVVLILVRKVRPGTIATGE